MRPTFYKLLSVFVVIIFIGYWILIPMLSLPHVPRQTSIASTFEKPTKWFVFNWRFFARPATFNQRLYLVTRNEQLLKADTIELIEPITKQKQAEIPFNQRENILDHFIHYYAANVHRNTIKIRSKLELQQPAQADSVHANTINIEMQQSKDARPALLVLDRYCRNYIQQQFVYTNGLRYKYIITAKPISPANNTSDKKDEFFIYDSGYHNY